MNDKIIRKTLKKSIGVDYCKEYKPKKSICIEFKHIEEFFNKLVDKRFIKKINTHIDNLKRQKILCQKYEVIELRTIYDYLINTNDYYLMQLYESFNIVTIVNTDKYNIAHYKKNIKLSKQSEDQEQIYI